MRRLAWVATACLAGPAGSAAGQESPVAPPPPVVEGPSPASDLPADTEVTLDKDTQVTVGIGFGGPIGAAASLRALHGLSADVREEGGRVRAVCALPLPHCAKGFTFQADAGSGGGKVSLGIGARARVEDDDFRGTVGAGLRASLVRTWGSPVGTEPDLTYLGPELDLSVVRVNLSVGVLWRVSGDRGASALFSWGVGFGL
jgi:hypothetical protein